MEKTIREHFEGLPEPYRSQAVENLRNFPLKGYNLDTTVPTQATAVNSFFWHETPEQSSYWLDVLKKLGSLPLEPIQGEESEQTEAKAEWKLAFAIWWSDFKAAHNSHRPNKSQIAEWFEQNVLSTPSPSVEAGEQGPEVNGWKIMDSVEEGETCVYKRTEEGVTTIAMDGDTVMVSFVALTGSKRKDFYKFMDLSQPASQQPEQGTGEQEWKETIDRISGSIAWCRENGEQETEISWGNQEGILLTVKEAEYFLSLQSRLSSVEGNNDTLAFNNKKLREKVSSLEQEKTKWMNLSEHWQKEAIELQAQLREAKEENERLKADLKRLKTPDIAPPSIQEIQGRKTN
jgi:hypothetical protein